MEDQCVQVLGHEGRIRIYTLSAKQVVQDALDRHHLSPSATMVLGKVLCVALIMGAMLKEKGEQIRVEMDTDGVLGRVIAEADAQGNVRGFVDHPQAETDDPTNDALAIGDGQLTVIRMDGTQTVWRSSVAIEHHQVGEDFVHYYQISEQIPSALSVGVRVNRNGFVTSAGGLLVQMMPDANETDIRMAEYAVAHLKPMTTILEEGMDAKELGMALFADSEFMAATPVQFHCTCSHEQMERILITLPKEDLESLLDEPHGVELVCHYCNTAYRFTRDEVTEIIHRRQA